MGQQYQDTISSFAASPQAMDQQQGPGNNTLGKSLEQSPMHDGFGTRSSMYDNGMDTNPQPVPVAMPPQPKNQPASAGINPSWAQQGRKRGGRTKKAAGGPLDAFATGPISPLMMTGDTLAKMPQMIQPPPPPLPQQTSTTPISQSGQGQLGRPTNVTSADLNTSTTANIPLGIPDWKASNPNEEAIGGLYQQYLGRTPDQAGLDFWINALKSGVPLEDIGQKLKSSSEVTSRVIPGWKARNPYEQTIGEFYERELGRNPDQGGLDFWINALQSGINPEAISMAFQASPEFRNKAYRARQNVLYNSPQSGVYKDEPGTIDPFVAMYNARMANANNLYGSIAQQNYAQNSGDQAEYQRQLAEVQAANQKRLDEARKAKAEREANEAAQRQSQLIAMTLMRR